MFVFVLVYVAMCPTSFAIILTRKIVLVALLLLFFGCLVTVNVLWLFLTVPWVGLQFVIVLFPDQTHLLFSFKKSFRAPSSVTLVSVMNGNILTSRVTP